MSWNNLYFLPILALVACKVLPVLPDKKRARRLRAKRKKYRTYSALVSRWLVFSLLAATALTLLFPLQNQQPLVQGILITGILMIPLLIFVTFSFLTQLVSSFFRESEEEIQPAPPIASANRSVERPLPVRNRIDSGPRVESNLRDVNGANLSGMREELSAQQKAELAEVGSANARGRNELLAIEELPRNKAGHVEDSANTLDGLDDASDILSNDLGIENGDDTVIDDEVLRGQLDRVSSNIGSYDLGERKDQKSHLYNGEVHDLNKGKRLDNKNTPKYNDVFETSDTKLTAKSEKALILKRKFIALQQDKKKLQRLVIAQQAAFDSEQLAHARSRTMAKEAIRIMRDARESQRIAVKVARIERSKRKNLEKEYTRVNKALVNALSTIQETDYPREKKISNKFQ